MVGFDGLTLSFRQGYEKIGDISKKRQSTQRLNKISASSTQPSDHQLSPPSCAREGQTSHNLPWAFTMAAADPGEVFIHDIAALPIFQPESTKNDDVPDAEDFDDDASQFTTASINSVSEGNI